MRRTGACYPNRGRTRSNRGNAVPTVRTRFNPLSGRGASGPVTGYTHRIGLAVRAHELYTRRNNIVRFGVSGTSLAPRVSNRYIYIITIKLCGGAATHAVILFTRKSSVVHRPRARVPTYRETRARRRTSIRFDPSAKLVRAHSAGAKGVF